MNIFINRLHSFMFLMFVRIPTSIANFSGQRIKIKLFVVVKQQVKIMQVIPMVLYEISFIKL